MLRHHGRDRAGQADACHGAELSNDAGVKAVQAAIDLAEQAQSVGPVAGSNRKSPQTR
jgi:hypothetical protein